MSERNNSPQKGDKTNINRAFSVYEKKKRSNDMRSSHNSERYNNRQRNSDARRTSSSSHGGQHTNAAQSATENSASLFTPTAKGLVGILIALILVLLIILSFSKLLFVNETTDTGITGTITSTRATGTTVATTTGSGDNGHRTKTTKEKIRYNVDSNAKTDKNSPSSGKQIKCTSAVLVHPQPNSKSGDIGTVPQGATVEFIKDENGWYYIKYNDITGYAWGQFFETPGN